MNDLTCMFRLKFCAVICAVINLLAVSSSRAEDRNYTGTIEVIEYSRPDARSRKLEEKARLTGTFRWERGDPVRGSAMGLSSEIRDLLEAPPPPLLWNQGGGYVIGGTVAAIGDMLEFHPHLLIEVAPFPQLKALHPGLEDTRQCVQIRISGSKALSKFDTGLDSQAGNQISRSSILYFVNELGWKVLRKAEPQFYLKAKMALGKFESTAKKDLEKASARLSEEKAYTLANGPGADPEAAERFERRFDEANDAFDNAFNQGEGAVGIYQLYKLKSER